MRRSWRGLLLGIPHRRGGEPHHAHVVRVADCVFPTGVGVNLQGKPVLGANLVAYSPQAWG